MMEASRHSDGAHSDRSQVDDSSPKLVVGQVDAASLSSLDAQLFKSSDRVAKELEEEKEEGDRKRASLTSTKTSDASEDRQHRAARFFAMHGLGSVGKLLGEEISSDEQQQLQKEQEQTAAAEAMTRSSSASSFRGAKAPSLSAPSAPVDLDLDLEDDESEKEERKRWQAVDALRHRHTHM